MIDLFTIQSLESKDSLFGLLNNILTPMGSWKLGNEIYQDRSRILD